MKALLLTLVSITWIVSIECSSVTKQLQAATENMFPSMASFKRQEFSDYCFKYQCVGEGSSCNNDQDLPAPCNACVNTAGECALQAVNAENLTLGCECWHELVECLANSTVCNTPSIINVAGLGCLTYQTTLQFECPQCPPFDPSKLRVLACKEPSFTCNANSTCAKVAGEGQVCTEDEECGDGLVAPSKTFACKDDKCIASGFFALVNDGCVEDVDCFGSLTCESKICKGAALNETCSDDRDCDFGLYCDGETDVCIPRPTVGEKCTKHTLDSCEFGASCLNGTCNAIYSVAKGGHCEESENCKMGLACLQQQCVDEPTTFEPCNLEFEDKSCNANEECVCNPYVGGSFCQNVDYRGDTLPASCQQGLEPLLSCFKENGCMTISSEPTSCAQQKCSKQTNCAIQCFMQTASTKAIVDAGCLEIPDGLCDSEATTDSNSSSGVLLEAIWLLAFWALTLTV